MNKFAILFVWLMINNYLLAQTYTTPPYSTGFESGLGAEWTTSTSAPEGLVQVHSGSTPRSGMYHLSLTGTQWFPVVNSTNAALLHLDLSSSIGVELEFWIEDYIEESHPENGVFFSDDGGASFVKVHHLDGTSYTDNTYGEVTLDVSALASANGLSLTSNFIIKFQQYGYEPISSDGFSFDDLTVTRQSALPVELTNFSALLENSNVLLNWTTKTEINNDYFTLQRSKNGFDWEEITIISGAGNSHSPLNYKYIDESPYPGTSYYRLKQTDFDGSYKFSSIETVNITGLELINLYPNPSSGNYHYTIVSSQSGMVEANVFDVSGKWIFSKEFEVKEGMNTIKNNVDLSTGTYFLKVRFKETEYRDQKMLVIR